jgi:two-component system cell cycle sensor histidine kinase/response regulator CckA
MAAQGCAWDIAGVAHPPDPRVLGDPRWRPWFALFAGSAALLVVLALAFYRTRARDLRDNIYKNIAAVSALKTEQIERWRLERLADAHITSEHPLLVRAAALPSTAPLPATLARDIRNLFATTSGGHGYSDVLLFSGTRPVVTLREPATPARTTTTGVIQAAATSGSATLSNFSRGADSSVKVDVAAPVGAKGSGFVVVLRATTDDYLYPLFRYWPTPTRTATTQMLRLDGENVVVLNEQWMGLGDSVAVTVPLTQVEVAAARAGRGLRGRFEGPDHRGVHVLADVRAVRDSPWIIISKMDVDEVAEQIRGEARRIGVVTALSILLVGVLCALGYRQRQATRMREQYAADAASRRSLALFESVFDNAAIGIALIGRDRRPLRCNAALERILGYSAAELRTRSFAEVTHPEDLQVDAAMFADLLAGTRARYQIEKRYLRKDGAVVWGRLRTSYLGLDETGEPIIVGMVEDITDEYLAKIERERLLNDLGERIKEATGLHATASILQDDSLDIPAILARVATVVAQAFQFPKLARVQIRYGALSSPPCGEPGDAATLGEMFETSEGTCGSILVWYSPASPSGPRDPFLPEEQQLVESIAEMLETSIDRRIAERALLQSEERLKLSLTAAGMGIWEWDIATDKVSWSDELLEIAGLERETVIGTLAAFRERVHPDDRDALAQVVSKALAGASPGSSFEFQLRLMRPDGAVRWVATSGRAFRDENGRPVRMLGIAHDISARRQLEAQLQQAQKMDALGQLAGGVAHDFNNLLTAIKSHAEFVLDELPEGDERRADLDGIMSVTDRAEELTRRLLAFSRHQVLAPRIIDPNAVVASVDRLLRRLIGADVEMAVSLGADVGSVRADATQLEQVLLNLAVNARDAMPDGGTLSISTRSTEIVAGGADDGRQVNPGNYVVLAVRDTGTGITPETKLRMFEPFFTTKGPSRGTGLGLATVYGIVQQSGGTIHVETAVGRGTTFEVYLPQVDTEPELPVAAAPVGRARRGTETVVLVDDDELVRAPAERALVAYGYHVIAFDTGAAALAYLERSKEPVDLLVTDVVMPGMQGPELAQRILLLRPGLPVLYITGYADRDIELVAAAMVLPKPFSPTTLAQTVRQALDRD